MKYRILEHKMVMAKCPTDACHASTVLKLGDGRALVAWFGGTEEGASDVGIWLAAEENGAFSPPRRIAGSDVPHWNPVLFQLDADTIALYYKIGHTISHWRTMVRYSKDNGRTFSQERPLVPGDAISRGPVRSKPIRLKSGRILAPSSLEENFWRAFVDRSDDDGQTWTPSNEIVIGSAQNPEGDESRAIPVSEQSHGKVGVIQPTLWQSADGAVHMLLRSTEGCVYRADSNDEGETFGAAVAIDLPNNNSGIDITQLENGALVLAMNPVGENWGPRTPLSLMVSTDDGKTFENLLDLETEEGEFSYPAIVPDGKGIIVTYTHRRTNIALWRIQLEDKR